MTPRQKQALDFIRSEILSTGISPSYEEIQAHLGLASKSGVYRLVHGLVERGHLRSIPNRNRALKLPGAPATATEIVDALFKSDHAFDDGDGPILALTREEAVSILQNILGG